MTTTGWEGGAVGWMAAPETSTIRFPFESYAASVVDDGWSSIPVVNDRQPRSDGTGLSARSRVVAEP